MKRGDAILLAHGSGGRLTHELVRDLFLPSLDNPALETLSDAAILEALPSGRPALTTDGFVVEVVVPMVEVTQTRGYVNRGPLLPVHEVSWASVKGQYQR